MRKSVSNFFATIALVLATACAAPPAPEVKPISFTSKPTINLDVADIKVVEAYKSPYSAPNVEHLMPTSPAEAMKTWVHDRLRATGANKLLQITIVDASVVATELPKTKGVKGLFTVDQDKKYDAKLEVELRIYGENPISEADTSVTVTRTISIAENASVNARNAAYQNMVKDLMDMLNDKLEKNMQSYFSNYISYSGN